MDQSLYVYVNKDFVGGISKDSLGGIRFEYAPDVKFPISMSLPLKEGVYENKECRGFFNGLLPEGESVRVAIGKKYGINHKNDFSILKAVGYDCAGAVSFFETPQTGLREFFEIEGKILSDDELEKYILELPKKPLALGIDMRLSLAGAQDKTAVVLIDGKVAIPTGGVPTTHILKPEIAGFKETTENEYICLKSAKRLEIQVPETEIRKANETKFFLIERYDRVIENGLVKRVHQEDFCQASNIVSAYKYQAEGGVDFKQCFNILRQTSAPAITIMRFINLMVFNYLIGNHDAHGKNFSILHLDDGRLDFAPAYDILCSSVYQELSPKMAMKIGGYYEPEKILPRHFERFANDVGISYTQLKKVIINQCKILPDIVKEVSQSFENTIGKDILSVVEKNCKRTLDNFNG